MMKSVLVAISIFFTIQLVFPVVLTAGTDIITGPIHLADKNDKKEEEKRREQEKKFEEKKREQEKKFEEKKREQEKKFEEKKREQEKKFEEKKREQEKKFEEKKREQEKKFEEKKREREYEQEREEPKQDDEKTDDSGSSDSRQAPGETRPRPENSGKSPDGGKSGCVALKDVHGNLSNYKGKTVTVCGNVTELLEIPIIKTGAYKLNDGTDTLWVIPSGSVPGKGSSVRVTGKIDVEVKIAGIALGVVLREN